MKCEDIQELITADVDGELAEEAKSTLQDHLRNCPACKADYELELTTKTFLKRRLNRVVAPPNLRAQITAELATQASSAPRFGEWLNELFNRRSPRAMLALGSLVAVLLVVLTVTPPKPHHSHAQPVDANIIHQTWNNFDNVLDGKFDPQVATDDPVVLRSYFASKVPFKVNCPKHRGTRLVGGASSRYNNEPCANVVYRNGRDVIYVYETNYRCVAHGPNLNLPREALNQLQASGWYCEHPHPECTLVVWLVDSTVCCAAADMTQDKLLAFLREGE